MEQLMDGRLPTGQSRLTGVAFGAGTLAAAGCLLIGLALRLGGAPSEAGDPVRPAEIVESVLAFRPWGWSMLGVLLLLLTPAAGLLTTFVELRRHEPRAAWLALVVLGVLAAAAVMAIR
jgi:uncharacterized membrane protein